MNYPPPTTVKELRQFLGMYNFYRRFVPNAAKFQSSLHDILAGPKTKGTQSITMTPEQQEAFNSCKTSISEAVMLAHPGPAAQLAMFTDASDTFMGAALHQKCEDNWKPLGLFTTPLFCRKEV